MTKLKNLGKRGLSLLIASMMCVGMMPVNAFAAEGESFDSPDESISQDVGTTETPEISETVEVPETTEDSETAEDSETSEDSEDSESTEASEDTEDAETAEDAEDTADSEDAEDSEDTETAEDAEDTEESADSETVEDTEDSADTEDAADTADAETPADAETAADTETPEGSEPAADAEIPEGSEAPEVPETAEDPAASENVETVEVPETQEDVPAPAVPETPSETAVQMSAEPSSDSIDTVDRIDDDDDDDDEDDDDRSDSAQSEEAEAPEETADAEPAESPAASEAEEQPAAEEQPQTAAADEAEETAEAPEEPAVSKPAMNRAFSAAVESPAAVAAVDPEPAAASVEAVPAEPAAPAPQTAEPEQTGILASVAKAAETVVTKVVDSWKALVDFFTDSSSEGTTPKKAELANDIEADNTLSVNQSGIEFFLDLCGFKILGKGTGSVLNVIGGTLTIEDSSEEKDGQIVGNKANGSTYRVIEVSENGSLTLNGGTITGGNGGIGVGGTGVSLTMNGGSIRDNRVTGGNGGGVLVYGGGTFTMNGGTIANNSADKSQSGTAFSGGGVHVTGAGSTFTMENGTISGNTASKDGGGVSFVSSGTFTMKGGTISGNEAQNGGGVSSSGTFTMTDGTISGNTASQNGGGVSSSGTFTMTDGEISKNNAQKGGGVSTSGKFTMSGGTISGNEANSKDWDSSSYKQGTPLGQGGGVYVSDGGVFALEKTGTIDGNTAGEGGGVYITGASKDQEAFTMTGGTVSKNTAKLGEGGGIYIHTAAAEISAGRIEENHTETTTDLGGGGIYIEVGGKLQLLNAIISDNKSQGLGGGLAGCVHGQTVIYVTDGAAIFDNEADGTANAEGHGGNGNFIDGYDKWKDSSDFITSAKDIFTAGNGTEGGGAMINTNALGGNSAGWAGFVDGVPVDNNGKPIFSESYLGLTSNLTEEAIADADAAGKVFITGNTSSVHGGGIANNGLLIIGKEGETTPKVDLQVDKELLFGDEKQKMQEGAFSFILCDEHGKPYKDEKGNDVVASVGADGKAKFDLPDSLLKGMEGVENGASKEFVFKIKEINSGDQNITDINSVDPNITYDDSEHTVTVRIKKTVANGSFGSDDAVNGIHKIDQMTTYTLESVKYVNGAGEEETSARFTNKYDNFEIDLTKTTSEGETITHDSARFVLFTIKDGKRQYVTYDEATKEYTYSEEEFAFSTVNGKLNFNELKLKQGETFYLQEIEAPDGYEVDPNVYAITDKATYEEMFGTDRQQEIVAAEDELAGSEYGQNEKARQEAEEKLEGYLDELRRDPANADMTDQELVDALEAKLQSKIDEFYARDFGTAEDASQAEKDFRQFYDQIQDYQAKGEALKAQRELLDAFVQTEQSMSLEDLEKKLEAYSGMISGAESKYNELTAQLKKCTTADEAKKIVDQISELKSDVEGWQAEFDKLNGYKSKTFDGYKATIADLEKELNESDIAGVQEQYEAAFEALIASRTDITDLQTLLKNINGALGKIAAAQAKEISENDRALIQKLADLKAAHLSELGLEYNWFDKDHNKLEGYQDLNTKLVMTLNFKNQIVKQSITAPTVEVTPKSFEVCVGKQVSMGNFTHEMIQTDDPRYTFELNKTTYTVDAEGNRIDGEKLKGVEFTLSYKAGDKTYYYNGSTFEEKEVSFTVDGSIKFENLLKNQVYELREKTPLEGYVKDPIVYLITSSDKVTDVSNLSKPEVEAIKNLQNAILQKDSILKGESDAFADSVNGIKDENTQADEALVNEMSEKLQGETQKIQDALTKLEQDNKNSRDKLAEETEAYHKLQTETFGSYAEELKVLDPNSHIENLAGKSYENLLSEYDELKKLLSDEKLTFDRLTEEYYGLNRETSANDAKAASLQAQIERLRKEAEARQSRLETLQKVIEYYRAEKILPKEAEITQLVEQINKGYEAFPELKERCENELKKVVEQINAELAKRLEDSHNEYSKNFNTLLAARKDLVDEYNELVRQYKAAIQDAEKDPLYALLADSNFNFDNVQIPDWEWEELQLIYDPYTLSAILASNGVEGSEQIAFGSFDPTSFGFAFTPISVNRPDDRTEGDADADADDDDDDDTDSDTPDEETEETEVPDEPMPLSEEPETPVEEAEELTDIFDDETPLSDMTDDEEELLELPDPDVPLADVPLTGDNTGMLVLIAACAIAALAWLSLSEKRRSI